MHLLKVSLHKLTMLYSKANLSSEWSQYPRKIFSQNYETKLDTVHHSSRPLYHQNTANLPDQIIIRIMQLVFEAKPELSPPFSKAILSSEWSQSPWPNLNQNHATNPLGHTRLSPPFSKANLSSEWSQYPRKIFSQNYDTKLDTVHHSSRPLYHQNTANLPDQIIIRIMQLVFEAKPELSPPFFEAILSSEWSQSPWPNLNQNHATNLLGHTRLSPTFSKTNLSSEWSQYPRKIFSQNYDTKLDTVHHSSRPLYHQNTANLQTKSLSESCN